MKSKRTVRLLTPLVIAFFWILVWFLCSLLVGNSYFLPSPIETAAALFSLLSSAEFYTVALLSLFRVIVGLASGALVGAALAILSHRFRLVRSFISPLISVVKAMPVATFIIILWISLRGSMLTVFIGFMMVMPIIYQNLLDGYDSIDKSLVEVTEVFEFSPFKRFRLLTFPALFSYFCPALITSIGLAFKSQIAAEIIAYTKDSIGQFIFDAKYNLQTDLVFAWAFVIVCFSLALEAVSKKLLGRLKYESRAD